jgi:hypothetical protein
VLGFVEGLEDFFWNRIGCELGWFWGGRGYEETDERGLRKANPHFACTDAGLAQQAQEAQHMRPEILATPAQAARELRLHLYTSEMLAWCLQQQY